MSAKFQLGDRVYANHYVVKVRRYDNTVTTTTLWIRYGRNADPVTLRGVVVGKRTVWEGTSSPVDSMGGLLVFTPTRHREVYLVAESLRTRPLYVLPEDLHHAAEEPGS